MKIEESPKEKISSPSAGLLERNLEDSVAGSHLVPCLGVPARFSHPRDPKISKVAIGPNCFGERNFLLSKGRISPLEVALGVSPSSEADTYLLAFNLNRQLPNSLALSSFSPTIGKKTDFFLTPETTVGRTSAGRGRFC